MEEDGYREILGFYVGGKKSSLGWKDILRDLYEQGAEKVHLGIFDGIPGLERTFKDIYSKANI